MQNSNTGFSDYQKYYEQYGKDEPKTTNGNYTNPNYSNPNYGNPNYAAYPKNPYYSAYINSGQTTQIKKDMETTEELLQKIKRMSEELQDIKNKVLELQNNNHHVKISSAKIAPQQGYRINHPAPQMSATLYNQGLPVRITTPKETISKETVKK